MWKRMLLCIILIYLFPMIVIRIFPAAEKTEISQNIKEPLPSLPPAEMPIEKEPSQGIVSRFIRLRTENGVETLDLESYVTGVIFAEMPADFETEALKAQAVVARTYAMRMFQSPKHTDAEVCGDPQCCQGFLTIDEYYYHGGKDAAIEKIRGAVRSTAGEVLTYQDKLIEATYFSCSGGRTEDAVAVWGNDIPYLQSVESPGEEKANFYTDTLVLDIGDFRNKLGLSSADIAVKDVVYSKGGGIISLKINGKSFLGTQLRKLLSLRSTAFTMTVVGQSVVITTKGYGHRVGMSQYGADAMALIGSSYRDILYHYYQGVTITAL